MFKKILPFVIAALVLASCGSTKEKEQKKVKALIDYNGMFATLDDSQNPYRETEERINDILHTLLKVSFDWEKSQMKGYAELTIKPHFYPVDSLMLDAKSMEILDVELAGKKTTAFSYDGEFLRLKLNKTYNRNETYVVKINYIAKPEEWEVGGSDAITSDKGLYFINPKGEQEGVMPQIWTQGETEASSIWFPTIDAPNEKTTQEIYMTVQDKYMTLSNGLLISSVKNADGTRTDYWKQDLPHAPYLFMMAVGEFETIHDEVTLKSGKTIEVDYIVEKEWAKYAKDIFGETPAMILYFSDLLGVEYPWDKYHQIIVREYVSGAMENTTAVIHGDYFYKTRRELLDEDDQSTIAHELFHHWFGDLVTCESWSNLPLNESFANYSQYLWDEHRYGIDQADYYAEDEEMGYKNSAQYQGHHNLIWFKYSDKENMFDGHSYNKGGRILHMLRDYLGDEAFFESLRVYLKENEYQPAEVHQLRLAFEKVSGKDLNPFFDQWFFGKGHPSYEISQSVYSNELDIAIKQVQDVEKSQLFSVPMKVEIHTTEGIQKENILVNQKENKFNFIFKGDLLNVKIDPKRTVLCDRIEDKPIEQFIYQYKNPACFKDRKDAVKVFAKSKNQEAQNLLFEALNDKFWGIREYALDYTDEMFKIDSEKLLAKLKEMAKNDEKSVVRSYALDNLIDLYEEKDGVRSAIQAAFKDSSYAVISSALYGLAELNTSDDLSKIKRFESEKNEEVLGTIADIYANYGSMTNKSFFEKTLQRNDVSNYTKMQVIYSYTGFLAKQPIDNISTGLNVYSDVAKKNNGTVRESCTYALDNLKTAYQKYDEVLATRIDNFEKEKRNADAMYAKNERVKLEQLIRDISNKMEEIQMMDLKQIKK